MVEGFIRIVEYVEKKLGKKIARIITYLILVGATIAGTLWLAVFAIDKIDRLSQRFDVELIPNTITIISLGQFWNAIANLIALLIGLFGVMLIALMPFVFIGYFVLDATQRGKAEYLIRSAKMILNQSQLQVPTEYQSAYQNVVQQLDRLQPKNSVFRVFQEILGKRVKPIKTMGGKKK